MLLCDVSNYRTPDKKKNKVGKKKFVIPGGESPSAPIFSKGL